MQIHYPEKSIFFYTEVLGMALVDTQKNKAKTLYILQYKNSNHQITLLHDSACKVMDYEQTAVDNYWKYSLFVNNIGQVYQQLISNKSTIGMPFQFGNIGYLAHTQDVENHQLEFIQKTFKQNTRPCIPDNDDFLKESPVLGLLTIRTKDPLKSIKLFEDVLGLKLLVRMYVDRNGGFALYFLGDKRLKAPNPDIDAIENREWMYQQNHLFIEIQYYRDSLYNPDFKLNKAGNGLQTIDFQGDTIKIIQNLETLNIPYQTTKDKKQVVFTTIDEHTIAIKPAVI
ncbi:MAG: hypothetical protein ACWIPH_09635 [Ostreibacterium sp.]